MFAVDLRRCYEKYGVRLGMKDRKLQETPSIIYYTHSVTVCYRRRAFLTFDENVGVEANDGQAHSPLAVNRGPDGTQSNNQHMSKSV